MMEVQIKTTMSYLTLMRMVISKTNKKTNKQIITINGHAAETGTHSPTARQGRLAASPSPDPLDVFSKPQPFDNTHLMRLDVTFQTGACPTWVRPLHVVFVFVLEKAPDAFWSQLFPLAALARPFPARVI